MRLKPSAVLIATLAVLFFLGIVHAALGQQGKTQAGSVMTTFTCRTLQGKEFRYEPRSDRVTILAFVTAYQKQSDRTIDDLLSLVASARGAGHPVELLLVVSGDMSAEYLEKTRGGFSPYITVLKDDQDALWGKLGVIVAPTTFLVDSEGVVSWVRAGHSFDFAVEAEARLDSALGKEPAPDRGDAPSVPKPAPPDKPELAGKHIRMAQILARRGDLEAAVDEGRQAADLTPEAVPVRLELVRLLCLAGRAEEALALTGTIVPENEQNRAQLLALSGWAQRLKGELDPALASLTESTTLDPTSSRAMYELGKVLEAKGDCESAMKAYARALALVYAADPNQR